VVTQSLDATSIAPMTRAVVRASPGDLASGARLGDWVIECKIGEGGMGQVYAAVHAVIGKRAAIKVIRTELATPTGAERFVQEARVVNQIGHPNIVDIFHIGQLDDGRPYLVMELLRGRTLGERLGEARIPPTIAIDLLQQMCAALAAAHAHGVIHRDLKPENVFVSDTPRGPVVKLVDWGIAKLVDTAELGSDTPRSMTRSGTLIGTPQYLSPEQARGRGVDERTDIYSLGAIAYELFLEEPPFTADNVADLIAMHLREPVPTPSDVWPDIPRRLEALLVAMLAKLPGERPSLIEVNAALGEAREELLTRGEMIRTRRIASGSLPPPSLGPLRATPAGVPALPAVASVPPQSDITTRVRRGSVAGWAIALGAAAVAAIAAVGIYVAREDERRRPV
jgi:serine/threonine-protein kinase